MLLTLVTLVAACSSSVQSATQPAAQFTTQPVSPEEAATLTVAPKPSVASSTNGSAVNSPQETAQEFTEGCLEEGPTIPRQAVVLGGISTDMTLAEVKQRLGEPLSEKFEETGCCGVLVYLEYPTLSLGLHEDGSVFAMSTTHSEVPTGAGVRVGDSHEAVTRAYGSPSVLSAEGLNYYSYHIEGSCQTDNFSFRIEGGRVAEISYYTLLN